MNKDEQLDNDAKKRLEDANQVSSSKCKYFFSNRYDKVEFLYSIKSKYP